MNVPEINEIKSLLKHLKSQNLIVEWELPYENLLTRRSAAIFFLTLDEKVTDENVIWKHFKEYENFNYRLNNEKSLSQLKYRMVFNQEEPSQVSEKSEI